MFGYTGYDIEKYICKNVSGTQTEYDKVVAAYIIYYNSRSMRCKWSFYVISLMKLILLGMIPVLQTMGAAISFPWLVTSFSSGIIFLEAVQELFRLKEKWILYRNTCNSLLSVQRQYTGASQVKFDSKTIEYIAAIEEIIGEEARQWLEMSRERKQNQNIDQSGNEGNSEDG